MRLRRAPANPGAEMTILEHVAELRDRLVKCFAALLVATLVSAFVLYDRTFAFITRSYCQIPARYRITTAAGQGCGLLAQSPLEGIGIRIRLSLVLGLLIAMPVIAFQVWRFVAPGLKQSEKRFAVPFAVASTLLFAGGVVVAFVTMPKAIGFLVAAGGHGLINFYAADRYLRFVLFMGIAFGLTFEFPIVLVFLSMAGVLSSAAMLRAWRPAVALIIVAAAVITPSQDPFSLFAMAIPMWIFYFAAAGVARWLIEPWRRRRQAELMQGS
jgi:sec-independent protein translocase protein TatC